MKPQRTQMETHRRMLSKQDGTVAGIARAILDPLCEETAKLLKPAGVLPSDRLYVELNEEGDKFVVRAFAKHVVPPNPKIAKVVAAYEAGDVNDAGAKAMLAAFAGIELAAEKSFLEWIEDERAEAERAAQAVAASWIACDRWHKNVPEHDELGAGRWEMAATDVTALVVNANWPEAQIEFTPEARAIYQHLLLRFLGQTLTSQHIANFKIRGVMPDLPADYEEHPEKPLANYQKVEVNAALGKDGFAYFAEQGTGKTPPVIARICIEARRKAERELAAAATEGRKRRQYNVIIVCPKNVRFNWQKEFEAFATRPGKVNVLRGGQLKRLKALVETVKVDDEDSEYGVVVASYETVKKSWEHLRLIEWDLAVLDESHYIKSVHRERGKAMLELRDRSDERMVLTGTPVANSILDLYMQLEFLAPGMSGFASWEKFRKFYGVFERAGQFEKLVSYQNLPFLKERLARIAFQISKKEALPNLPGKVYDVRECEMTRKQREHYLKLQSQLALEIEDGTTAGGKKLTAQHILVKLLRLAQITSGFVCWDAVLDPETGDVLSERGVEYYDPCPKVDQIVEDIKALGEDEKAIIWACFRPAIKQLSDRLTQEGIPHGCFTGSTKDDARIQMEADFNGKHAREFKVLIGNPAAGGTGLNLRGYDPTAEVDHGCDATLVGYHCQGWSMVHRNQSEDRAHRRGTRRTVTYRDYVVPSTIDEEIRLRVVGKTENAMTIQDVREIMRRVLDTMPEEDDE